MNRALVLAFVAISIACGSSHARELTQADLETATTPLSFLGDLATGALEVNGLGTLKVQSSADVDGLALAQMSAIQLGMAPCTILQTHIHTHSEMVYVVKGTNVTVEVAYVNGSTPQVDSKSGLGAGAFAAFPVGLPHVTQNEGCDEAILLAIFPVAVPVTYYLPLTESVFKANSLAAAYGTNASDAASFKAQLQNVTTPLGQLADCAARCNLTSSS